MDFSAYDLDGAIYDEMFLSDGTPREQCRQLHETLSPALRRGAGHYSGTGDALLLERGHHLHRVR